MKLSRLLYLLCLSSTLFAGSVAAWPTGALAQPISATPLPRSTPQLLVAAAERGHITHDQMMLYLAYTLYDAERLPPAYVGTILTSATPYVADVRNWLKAVTEPAIPAPAALKAEARRLRQVDGQLCDQANGAHEKQSAHFLLSYDTIGGGLNADDYLAALELSYDKLVRQYG